ncbi:hypothetical protein E3N88_44154 [Mikania micrantha]|uniref:Major facilitator superfamily (MFS) profile domain-containing protein n=1 Tax=Mikania micrantha TaxID=192012 RepID=A0A5N6LCW1_9ASTR|nr:hypothetical protein E3N88_44154 [Mikania micrantha]
MAGGGIPMAPGGDKAYPGNLTLYVTFTCVVAAMGGLIFGGVTAMDPFLKKFFPSVYRKQAADTSTNQYCKFDSGTLTMFTSSLYLAALLSSLVASTVTRTLGRKLSMLFGGALFCAGALINGFAQAVWMLIVGRILLGFGIGFANQSVPLYLSEMAPYKYRGSLNIGFQLSITIGILVANVLNYFFNKLDGNLGWRLSLGGAKRQDQDFAESEFDDIDEEFNDLIYASEESRKIEHPWRNLLQKKYRPQLTMAILIPFFQQLTGINVIMFYAPFCSKPSVFHSDASLMSAVITGSVNVLATCVSIYGVDKWAEDFFSSKEALKCSFVRSAHKLFDMLYICPLLCFLILIFKIILEQVAVAIFIGIKFGINGHADDLPKWYAIVVVLFICIYVAGFAWSWGPLGWLVPSEIFPLEIRSASKYQCLREHDLHNIPIEEMVIVWKKHWFWSRFMVDVDYPNGVELSKGGDIIKKV